MPTTLYRVGVAMEGEAKRKRSDSPTEQPSKVEIKEENVMGNDYLVAKGRLQGVLRELTQQSESDSEESDDSHNHRSRKSGDTPRKKSDSSGPMRSTYLMKLYDRSVDLAKFEEDTPLYPICRAWMANNSKKPHTVVKRRYSSPEPETSWNSNNVSDVYRLPPPTVLTVTRIPSPLPEQLDQSKDNINLNYEEKPPVPKNLLMKDHLKRWQNVKQKWIAQAHRFEERYAASKNLLQTIYTKAQENMTDDVQTQNGVSVLVESSHCSQDLRSRNSCTSVVGRTL